MVPSKPSIHVTTSPNHRPCFEVVCWKGNDAPGWWSGRVSVGAKTSPRKQGTDFDLVGTSQIVVVHETPGVTHTACQSGSFPYRVYIDLSHRDTLRYEWPLVRCSHLVVFMLCCWWLEDDDGYSYIIITIIVSTLLWRWHGSAFCLFMHVLVFRCKHNTWLIKMAKIMKAKDHMLVVVSLVPSNPSALHI
jgi:hypothetical protein